MVEYSKVNVKLSDTQLKKLKTAVKNKTGTALRISLKMFNGNDLPHELLLTTRQKTKLRNAFNNNMSTDLKLSEAQISKIIISGGCVSNWCRNSKKNTWFWNNNFDNFKWGNKWNNENCSSSWRF